jgi:hypothetical protein
MNIDLFKQISNIDVHLNNIQPYYTVEKHTSNSKKSILCIDYRCKEENLWYEQIKYKLPQYDFYFINSLRRSMTNALIINALKEILKDTHLDIICINFQSIMYSEWLKKKNISYKYKVCKAYNSSTNIACIFRCIFTFIRQITFVQMLSCKNNIKFFWYCGDLKLCNYIMFCFLNKQHFVGNTLLGSLFNKYNTVEAKLSESFFKKIKALE